MRAVRHVARILVGDWPRTVAALILLALGIGANASVFSLAAASLASSLPFRDPARLVSIVGTGLSPETLEWFAQSRALQALASYDVGGVSLGSDGGSARVFAADVSPTFFDVLGVWPVFGRSFAIQGQEEVLILSHGFWVRALGRDPGVIGRSLSVGGRVFVVVGVMGKDFHFPPQVDLWISRSRGGLRLFRSGTGCVDAPPALSAGIVGRLAPGVSVDLARRDVVRLQRAIEARDPTFGPSDISLVSLPEWLLGRVRAAFLPLLLASVAVWLVVCANVGHLLCVRAVARENELAVRWVMGASRRNLAGFFVFEGLCLAALGGGLGIVAGIWAQPLLARVSPLVMLGLADGVVNGRVVLASLGLCLLTGLACGGFASLLTARPDTASVLRAGSTVIGATTRGQVLIRMLLGAETAATLALLVAAGLMMKTVDSLQAVPLGLNVENILATQLFPTRGDLGERGPTSMLSQVRLIPGVTDAAFTTCLPLNPRAISLYLDPGNGRSGALAYYAAVSEDYFRVMGIPLLRGRRFEGRDAFQPVVILNKTAAAMLGRDPLGAKIRLGSEDLDVVGVVGNVKHRLSSPDWPPEAYLPLEHRLHGQRVLHSSLALVARAQPGFAGLVPALERRIREMEASVAATPVVPTTDMVARTIRMQRFRRACLAVLAVVALAVSALGVYGALSFDAAQRRREVAVRLAMGASPATVAWLVVRRGLRVMGWGLALGVSVSIGVGGLLKGFLWGVSPLDPHVYGGALAVMIASALLAMIVPAYRAGNIDPARLLREG